MHRKYRTPRTCPDIDTYEWAAWIEDHYGVVLTAQGLYADVDRRVYAGSEYVATLAEESTSPEHATRWTDTIAHMPRYGTGIEVARRQAS